MQPNEMLIQCCCWGQQFGKSIMFVLSVHSGVLPDMGCCHVVLCHEGVSEAFGNV